MQIKFQMRLFKLDHLHSSKHGAEQKVNRTLWWRTGHVSTGKTVNQNRINTRLLENSYKPKYLFL